MLIKKHLTLSIVLFNVTGSSRICLNNNAVSELNPKNAYGSVNDSKIFGPFILANNMALLCFRVSLKHNLITACKVSFSRGTFNKETHILEI